MPDEGLPPDDAGSASDVQRRAELDAVFGALYKDLRALASAFLAREQHAQSLQPTAVVHEVWERVIRQRNLEASDQRAFLAATATMMRRILVDHARARAARKRNGAVQQLSVSSGTESPDEEPSPVDVLKLDRALKRLEGVHPRAAKVVELRFFLGRTALESAAVLDVSERLVHQDWKFAKAFLHRELGGDAI